MAPCRVSLFTAKGIEHVSPPDLLVVPRALWELSFRDDDKDAAFLEMFQMQAAQEHAAQWWVFLLTIRHRATHIGQRMKKLFLLFLLASLLVGFAAHAATGESLIREVAPSIWRAAGFKVLKPTGWTRAASPIGVEYEVSKSGQKYRGFVVIIQGTGPQIYDLRKVTTK